MTYTENEKRLADAGETFKLNQLAPKKNIPSILSLNLFSGR